VEGPVGQAFEPDGDAESNVSSSQQANMSDPSQVESQLDRIIGCLIGGAIGDAWGSRYEGAKPPIHVDDSHDWMLTDDTQLTLATCDAICAANAVDPETIAGYFAKAFRSGQITGMGAGTYQALEGLAAGGHWALVGRKGDHAAGNGAAMRTAPLAFWLNPEIPTDRRILRDVSRITHHNDEAYVGSLAIVLGVRDAWQGKWQGGTGLVRSVAARLPDSKVRDRLQALDNADSSKPFTDIAAQFGNSVYVVDSVPLALFAAQQCHSSCDFKAWLRGIIEAGGDADTIASMAGQIEGCALGARAIPRELVARLPDPANLETRIHKFARRTVNDATKLR
jgi:ADP-ribosylglycohydrolase